MVILLTELFIKALKHPIAAVWILLCLKKKLKDSKFKSDDCRGTEAEDYNQYKDYNSCHLPCFKIHIFKEI